ncbi:hypothetical protein ACFLZY_01150 [Patescibacteria group bacterium]
MKIEELLNQIEPDSEMAIANEPFTYTGKAVITLDGGDKRYWIFNSDHSMLTVAPSGEELFHFLFSDEEIEPQSGVVLYQGDEFEFSYEDSGVISEIIGESDFEEEDQFSFADYESAEGALVRIVTNENTGERQVFTGTMVVEEDILKV